MNLNIISIVVRREYLNRVKKKSFLVTTFVVPVLFAAACLLPSIIMLSTRESVKKIALIDRSGIVAPAADSTSTVVFTPCLTMELDYAKSNLESLGFDAVLFVPEIDRESLSLQPELYSLKPLGVDASEDVRKVVSSALEAYKVESYGIEGLAQIIEAVKPDVRLRAFTLDEDGGEKLSESEVYMIVSVVLGMIIFMFITLFGAMVMSSVIEEKASRVVEVLISSVKATELMFGKIIGIALVALTQFLLWIVLTLALVGAAGAAMGSSLDISEADPSALVESVGLDPELGAVLTTFGNLDFGSIIACFFVFFILGYLLYASLYAAVGSAVENEGDSQQLQIPITVPLMIGFFIAMYTFKAPDSAIAFWGSMIPFTSPIVMLARLPFGVAGWEIALSIALLAATTALLAYLSAKIYKAGILMFGKKTSWKDLLKWLRQD